MKSDTISVILAIDDDSVVSQCRGILQYAGLSISESATAEALSSRLGEEHPDLIVVSATLPDATAESVCRMVRRRIGDSIVGIIVVGGRSEHDAIHAAMSAGADDFLEMPLRPFEFRTRVKSRTLLVRQRRAMTAADGGELYAGIFELIREIGRGAHSVVYHAIDRTKSASEEVALKVFDIEAYESVSTSFTSIFLREAYAMSKLEHNNLVRMLDFGKFARTYYLVMEFVRGDTLEDIIRDNGPMDDVNILLLGCQLLGALSYLQENHVVHRDIKPANILVTVEGEIKLTDFGLAKQQDDITLTNRNRKFMGTPAFVAPEQILGESDLDGRCDTYSLGATLFYCGTNVVPFTGVSVLDILSSNLSDELPLAHNLNPKIGKDLSSIIANMLAKERERRWSVDELQNRMLELLDSC